jgi:pimeloyl-ACP methyl ester carboxylesterase
MPAPTAREVATRDGVRISYDDLGQGEPALLLLPGWAHSRRVSEELAPVTATHRRTLALDWRGHGRSGPPPGDFGHADMVEDALAVVEASGAEQVVPVGQAHGNWVIVELRRRLGGRVPKLVALSWLMLGMPPAFQSALEAMQDPRRWEQARDALFAMWTERVDNPAVLRHVREDFAQSGYEIFARAGREITAEYARWGNPLQALARLEPPAPTLHVYAQPTDPGYLAAQQAFAAEHPWFSVLRLDARSHFPSLEVPEETAVAIEHFVGGPNPEVPG